MQRKHCHFIAFVIKNKYNTETFRLDRGSWVTKEMETEQKKKLKKLKFIINWIQLNQTKEYFITKSIFNDQNNN